MHRRGRDAQLGCTRLLAGESQVLRDRMLPCGVRLRVLLGCVHVEPFRTVTAPSLGMSRDGDVTRARTQRPRIRFASASRASHRSSFSMSSVSISAMRAPSAATRVLSECG